MEVLFTQGIVTRKIFVDKRIVGYFSKGKTPIKVCLFREGPKKLDECRKPIVEKDGDIILEVDSVGALRDIIYQKYQ